VTTVGVLGAGVAGIAVGMALRAAGIDDVVLYDRNDDVGGLWHTTDYPGLRCDIPSHLFSYTADPNPAWSHRYATGAEIAAYLRSCADRWGLRERIRFATTVERATFDAAAGMWTVELADGTTAQHRVLVSATGGLTAPSIPRIDGLDRFGGPWWHASRWRHDVSLAGRSVAVVGSAASAVQVVPAVAEVAASVTVYARTPNWVVPRADAAYDEATLDSFGDDVARRRHWRTLYRESLLWHRVFDRRPDAVEELRSTALANMHRHIADPGLRAALTPDFDPGCKRILVSDDYYPALARPHVRLVPRAVTGLSETGVIDAGGDEIPADVVVFCTGYRLGAREDGRPNVDVVAPDGRSFRAAMAARPEAYLGIVVPGFPNYFVVGGVNGSSGYGPFFLTAEIAAEFIARQTTRIVTEKLRTLEIRPEVTEQYNVEIQRRLGRMSWTGDCPNFYRDATGRIVSFFPGTFGELRRRCRTAPAADFLVSAQA